MKKLLFLGLLLLNFITFVKSAPNKVIPTKISTRDVPRLDCAKLGQGLVPRRGGPPGSSGFTNECCVGLHHVENKFSCGKAYGGYAGQCVACGDNKCDRLYENYCNCPGDCKK